MNDQSQPNPPSRSGRGGRVRAVTALAVAVLATGLVAACSPSTPARPAAPAAPPAAKKPHQATVGQVTGENGGTWTMTTAKGETLSVTLTPATKFGTPKAPATAQSFPVGTRVRVVGKRTDTTITANRIAQAKAKNATSPPSTPPSAPPTN
ncbi:MAG TPA: hypothetical protein VGM60_20815 [Pseudonocardia sp.]|uniref:hypothetical protein n=1 Tax=Pseudonocardia sp. TaxID=60912 RepID=UPI002F3FD438